MPICMHCMPSTYNVRRTYWYNQKLAAHISIEYNLHAYVVVTRITRIYQIVISLLKKKNRQ